MELIKAKRVRKYSTYEIQGFPCLKCKAPCITKTGLCRNCRVIKCKTCGKIETYSNLVKANCISCSKKFAGMDLKFVHVGAL